MLKNIKIVKRRKVRIQNRVNKFNNNTNHNINYNGKHY